MIVSLSAPGSYNFMLLIINLFILISYISALQSLADRIGVGSVQEGEDDHDDHEGHDHRRRRRDAHDIRSVSSHKRLRRYTYDVVLFMSYSPCLHYFYYFSSLLFYYLTPPPLTSGSGNMQYLMYM